MRYRNSARSFTRGISGVIILVGLVLAFIGGGFNLPIFFFFLAISIVVGALGSLNPRSIYGSFIGAMWMLILALFFITHWWVVFLIGAALSAFMGVLMRPLLAALTGLGLFGVASMMNNQPPQQPQQPYYQPQQPQQPYYQPPTQDPPSSYAPYQQGYQPPPPTYQEGGQPHQYTEQPAQYDQPQAQYPQQMPPQQQ